MCAHVCADAWDQGCGEGKRAFNAMEDVKVGRCGGCCCAVAHIEPHVCAYMTGRGIKGADEGGVSSVP